MQVLFLAPIAGVAACGSTPLQPTRPPLTGPLHVSTENPRYFADPAGRIVYLTGAHTWSTLQDYGFADPPRPFAYEAFLDSLVAWNHNFFRLWRWEQAAWQTETTRDYWFAPLPYARTGPGLALDGKPKFDLTRFDQGYFDRLHERAARAGARGVYVAVMLFNGWSTEGKQRQLGQPWRGHPFNAANNINSVDGDPDGDGEGTETHTLRLPQVVALQERYVRKVVATLNDLDNVLFEVSNESPSTSADWQYHIIRVVRHAEAGRAKQHPVGMTGFNPISDNAPLINSPADWISPDADVEHPPPANGDKVVLWDTDHLCGICGDRHTVWKAFVSGHNVVFMDPYDSTARQMDVHLGDDYDPQQPLWVLLRRNLGATLTYASRLPLARMTPHPAWSSTGYCLADTAREALLAYAPDGGSLDLDLSAFPGSYVVEWYAPHSGRVAPGGTLTGGVGRRLRPPYWRDAWLWRDAVVVLRRLGKASAR